MPLFILMLSGAYFIPILSVVMLSVMLIVMLSVMAVGLLILSVLQMFVRDDKSTLVSL